MLESEEEEMVAFLFFVAVAILFTFIGFLCWVAS